MGSDPLPLSLSLLLVVLLVMLNGFFAAAELAMVKVRGSRIDALIQEGHKRAKLAAHLTDNLNAYLSACQLGVTLVSLCLGWIGGPAIAGVIEPVLVTAGIANGTVLNVIAFVVAFSVVAFLHIILGELAPKALAARKSEGVTMWVAAPMIGFRRLMYPFVSLLNGTSEGLLRLFGMAQASEQDSARPEEEIRNLMKESHKSGLIDNTELTLVDNIFDFAETTAREIMIPRTEMNCLYANLSFEENQQMALQEMHTRYPVCENDKDDIIGFVHIKDLLKVSSQQLSNIRQIIRPITTVPESMQISQLLKLMQKKKTQIAILIDEYGGTSGLVTLEDIMEEIVGEIQDEFDEERPNIERKDETTFSINGMLLIEEVNSYFGIEIDSDEYDTIGGWIYSQIEIPPKRGQGIIFDERHKFVIEETDNLRISRITVRLIHDGENTDGLLVAETG